LNNPDLADPVATLSSKQEYIFSISTPEGCLAKDTIHIKVFEGPAVYVPTAFTPNGDGLNDLLRPVYVGIAKLDKFSVYNRWGQLVFSTSDIKKGWNGTTDGKASASGTYVWVIKATNSFNKSFVLKGTATIIR
jgi:gliding motility-associated-like protein